MPILIINPRDDAHPKRTSVSESNNHLFRRSNIEDYWLDWSHWTEGDIFCGAIKYGTSKHETQAKSEHNNIDKSQPGMCMCIYLIKTW